MQNLGLAPSPAPAAARPEVTAALTRGVMRLFWDLGFAPMPEFRLPNGRRADVVGLDQRGRIVIAEVKSCQADFETDGKWEDYLGYCDLFYFAVVEGFPQLLLPACEGLILADGFGGAIVREGPERPLAGARRKSLTLRYARQASARLAFAHDDAGE